MNRPLIVGIAGGIIVLAAIVLTFFIDREPDRPIRAVGVPDRAPPASARDSAPANTAAGDSAASGPAASTAAPPTDKAPRTTAAPSGTAPAGEPAGSAQTTETGKPDGPAGDAAAGSVASTPPSFDIVRVNPQGDVVIAGRAAPNSEVTIRMGDEVIGTVRADSRGEWVLVPQNPLAPGSHELTITSRTDDGREAVSERTVVIVVPQQGRDIAGRPSDAPSSPLAVAVPRTGDGPSVVLQAPGTSAGVPGLTLDAIDYGAAGDRLALSGRAPPGADVRVYLDNRFIGTARANEQGIWTLEPEGGVPPGLYRMRVDRVGPDGKVLARIELPFSRAEPFTDIANASVVFIQPGNTLWRLARQVYGGGLRYTVIYEANKDQIRNPDLIYPGQVFVLPKVN